jgi:sugar lactone lactonase YvrE
LPARGKPAFKIFEITFCQQREAHATAPVCTFAAAFTRPTISGSMTTVGEPVCVAPAGDKCGEGAVWHETENVLYWCDINRFLIHRYDPTEQSVRSWFFDEVVSAIALTDRDDTLAVALGSRLILWKPNSDHRKDYIFRLEGWPAVRLNDGRVDPRGSFWLGSMRNNVNSDGSSGEAGGTDGKLYRVDPDGNITEWRHDIGIANTLAWSPDRRRFYSADTLANAVRVYSYDARTGDIADEQPFLMNFARGLPDGSATDSEGYLWNCRYDGGCIVRIAPDGTVDRVIEMPVSKITTCTFGGPELRTLYVTTASNAAPPHERLAGGLFAIETEVSGQRENRFGLRK